MVAKITIPGVVELEGDEDFIREVYRDISGDLKSKLAARTVVNEAQSQQEAAASLQHVAPKDNGAASDGRKSTRQKAAATPRNDYKPSFKSNLDLKNLDNLYATHAPRNHSEKILLFVLYLQDDLKIVPCNADDIYSCYFTLKSKTKIPEAFVQALRDTKNKFGYIEFSSLDDIRITIAGYNYLHNNMKKKEL
jgi:hypothetical protein